MVSCLPPSLLLTQAMCLRERRVWWGLLSSSSNYFPPLTDTCLEGNHVRLRIGNEMERRGSAWILSRGIHKIQFQPLNWSVQCRHEKSKRLGPSSVCRELNSHLQVPSELAHCEINHLITCGTLGPPLFVRNWIARGISYVDLFFFLNGMSNWVLANIWISLFNWWHSKILTL